MKNKYGLDSYIPSEIRRQIRQACGFGCIICGSFLFHYHHVDPPFANAKEHKAECITLLCAQCHSKVHKGFTSEEAIKNAMKNPFSIARGYAREFLEVGKNQPTIIFAGNQIKCPYPLGFDCNSIFIPVLKIEKAEVNGGPFRLSAIFYNSMGNLILGIIENECVTLSENWDVEVIGKVITIREGPRIIALCLEVKPPDDIIIKKIDMLFLGHRFIGDDKQLNIIYPNGNKITFSNNYIESTYTGIMVGI